jgi:hypothetical protein
MAVVQISRIQIRRGRSLSGTGLPQLASGELAWSLDTQELYIGNGSVSEGSPAVGNTKVLTERDLTVQGNLLNLIQHIYKSNDPDIQTGPTVNDPISRSTQERLDDRVTATDFGTIANGTADDTEALQRAIDQLFLNSATKSSSDTADGVKTRVILELGPGIYKISGTLYIPSYATIIGAGSNKTIINYTGTGTAIRFVNDNSVSGNPSTITSTLYNTQPRFITLQNLTINTATNNQICLQLDAVRNSLFEDLVIKGNWTGTFNANSKGISLSAVSALVTCNDNTFNRINISGFSYGIWSNQDIQKNSFRNSKFSNLRQGVVFGEGADGITVGQQYGPRQNLFDACNFQDIQRHAVVVTRGSGNTVSNSVIENVGNNNAGVYFPVYPQIYYGSIGNSSQSNQSDREEFLVTQLFTVDLELDYPITASKGSLVRQNVSHVQGTLKEDYEDETNITIVTPFIAPFDTTNTLTVDSVFNPGETTTIEIISSSSVSDAFETNGLTGALLVGASITFNNTFGGVVAGTTYYVQSVVDSTHFKIANTYLDAVNITPTFRQLTPSAGISMFGTYNPKIRPTTVSSLSMIPYVPEITGTVSYKSYGVKQMTIGFASSWTLLSILPGSASQSGGAAGSVGYKIDYQYKSDSNNFTRNGTITLIADIDQSAITHSTITHLSDEYTVTGLSEEDALKLEFSAVILNQEGMEINGVSDVPASIALRYRHTLTGELLSSISYSYTAIH